MGAMINSQKGLFGKPDGRKPLVRLRRRWEDNIHIDIKIYGADV
jgi:hypothetical protein